VNTHSVLSQHAAPDNVAQSHHKPTAYWRRTVFLVCLALAVSLCLSCNKPAQTASNATPENGVPTASTGNNAKSDLSKMPLDELRKKAEAGEADAQFNLGCCYYNGEGVAKDDAEAVKWYCKAAEQGNAAAQYNLGVCYASSIGVPKDVAEAVKWFRKAVDQENAAAQYSLGWCYDHGEGVPKDDAEAMKWYRKAADQENAAAQFALGQCYLNGVGVLQDKVEAMKWYRKAAEQRYADAQYNAQYNLGWCYYNGEGVQKDAAEAVKWYRKAAEQGYALAQFALGQCYLNGKGVPKDDIEAYKWYNLAAAQGQEYAAKLRDSLTEQMTPQQIAEGQRRASLFVAGKENKGKGAAAATPDMADTPKGNGTGFFVAPGYLLTSHHVVKDADAIKIVTGESLRRAKIVKADPANDLALLKLLPPDGARFAVPSLPVLASRNVQLGDAVVTLGFPNIDMQGVEPKLTRGEINSLAGLHDDPRYFQMSVAVQPGNSGGPLVDLCGNVVGMVAARLSDRAALKTSGMLPQNVNYALKSSFILAFLDTVAEVTGKLPEPHREKERKFADVVKEVQQATVMVLVY